MGMHIDSPRILLLMTPTTYRATDFLGAGAAAGVEIVVGTNRAQTLAGLAPDHNLTLPFDDHAVAESLVLAYAARCPVQAVVGVDDEAVLPAARLAAALGLPHNTVASVAVTRSKVLMRECLAAAGVGGPPFLAAREMPDPARVGEEIGFPCVVKPASLSGSRGVVRVDRAGDLQAVWQRVRRILETARREERQGIEDDRLLLERFMPGEEVALEALLQEGRLRPLALFDKPDPMDGPVFAETIFVAPSRHPRPVQNAVLDATVAATTALGLSDGPIHAEFRIHGGEVGMLEVAARTIGGFCSRALRFAAGMSLEEIVLRHACRLSLPVLAREHQASGVFMLPVPRAGTLTAIHGLDEARGVDGIVDLVLTVPLGEEIVPLPEESRVLGFLFARGATPAAVERSLRAAGDRLEIEVKPPTP
jgi:biotin carboxylase